MVRVKNKNPTVVERVHSLSLLAAALFSQVAMASAGTKTKASKLYTRFAEVGRVVLIQYGPEAGKLATIVDIIDANRALIDGPENLTGVRRQIINFKWVALTNLKVKVSRNARQKKLTKEWAEAKVQEQWSTSSWAKKISAKKAKAATTDFDRFQIKEKKQKISAGARKALKVPA